MTGHAEHLGRTGSLRLRGQDGDRLRARPDTLGHDVLHPQVEGHDDGAQSPDGEERGHQPWVVRPPGHHAVPGTDPVAGEGRGDPAGAFAQLAVGPALVDRAAEQDDGVPLRRALDRALEQLHERLSGEGHDAGSSGGPRNIGPFSGRTATCGAGPASSRGSFDCMSALPCGGTGLGGPTHR